MKTKAVCSVKMKTQFIWDVTLCHSARSSWWLKGHQVFRTWDCMLNNTASHPKRCESQATCLWGPHIYSHSYKLSDNRIATFSYCTLIVLTMEMWSPLQGICRWWEVNWKHILITITVHIQSLIIYYSWNILVSWWWHQGIVSALTDRNSRIE